MGSYATVVNAGLVLSARRPSHSPTFLTQLNTRVNTPMGTFMDNQTQFKFKALGHRDAYEGLERVPLNRRTKVTFTSDEVTSLCPVSGQPDFSTVEIEIEGMFSIEIKSLKLYLQSFRQVGIMCEALAARIYEN